jgi:peptidyl-tRNA hydrolase, PTH1 family
VPARVIIGLGNPGARYADTRHNAGFMVVERLADRHRLAWSLPVGVVARVAEGRVGGVEVRLVEPLVFMNRSGEVLPGLVIAAGLAPVDLLVVHDEVDLPFGRIKLKQGGGHAGHRGLRSILEHVGDPGFARLRFGVGRPPEGVDTADWVLDPFPAGDAAGLDTLVEAGTEACLDWLQFDFPAAMNRANALRPLGGTGEGRSPAASGGHGSGPTNPVSGTS